MVMVRVFSSNQSVVPFVLICRTLFQFHDPGASMRLVVFMCVALLISARLDAQNSSKSAANLERKHQLDQQVPAWLKEFKVTQRFRCVHGRRQNCLHCLLR